MNNTNLRRRVTFQLFPITYRVWSKNLHRCLYCFTQLLISSLRVLADTLAQHFHACFGPVELNFGSYSCHVDYGRFTLFLLLGKLSPLDRHSRAQLRRYNSVCKKRVDLFCSDSEFDTQLVEGIVFRVSYRRFSCVISSCSEHDNQEGCLASKRVVETRTDTVVSSIVSSVNVDDVFGMFCLSLHADRYQTPLDHVRMQLQHNN